MTHASSPFPARGRCAVVATTHSPTEEDLPALHPCWRHPRPHDLVHAAAPVCIRVLIASSAQLHRHIPATSQQMMRRIRGEYLFGAKNKQMLPYSPCFSSALSL